MILPEIELLSRGSWLKTLTILPVLDMTTTLYPNSEDCNLIFFFCRHYSLVHFKAERVYLFETHIIKLICLKEENIDFNLTNLCFFVKRRKNAESFIIKSSPLDNDQLLIICTCSYEKRVLFLYMLIIVSFGATIKKKGLITFKSIYLSHRFSFVIFSDLILLSLVFLVILRHKSEKKKKKKKKKKRILKNI